MARCTEVAAVTRRAGQLDNKQQKQASNTTDVGTVTDEVVFNSFVRGRCAIASLGNPVT